VSNTRGSIFGKTAPNYWLKNSLPIGGGAVNRSLCAITKKARPLVERLGPLHTSLKKEP